MSRLRTAVPPGSSPSKIAAFSRAMPRTSRKAARCTASTVVISATCGRASRARGAISPGAFMPISMTAKSRSAGIRARVSGTPQWLLKLFSAAWTLPWAPRAARSISLAAGLADRAGHRHHAAGEAGAGGAAEGAQGFEHVGDDEEGRVLGHPLRAAGDQRGGGAVRPAPAATKSWPSRAAVSATKRSPGASERVSMETPVADQGRGLAPPVAATASSRVQSVMRRGRRGRRRRRSPARGRRRGGCPGRRSGRSRGPCRR